MPIIIMTLGTISCGFAIACHAVGSHLKYFPRFDEFTYGVQIWICGAACVRTDHLPCADPELIRQLLAFAVLPTLCLLGHWSTTYASITPRQALKKLKTYCELS